jgi:thioredoxin-like negative regulator of GroEL
MFIKFLSKAHNFAVEVIDGKKTMTIIPDDGVPVIGVVMYTWHNCTHCTELEPIMKKMPSMVPSMSFYVVDIGENSTPTQMSADTILPLTYVPQIIVYINGRPFMRFSGTRNESSLRQFLAQVQHAVNVSMPFHTPGQQQQTTTISSMPQQVPQQQQQHQQGPSQQHQQGPSQQQYAPHPQQLVSDMRRNASPEQGGFPPQQQQQPQQPQPPQQQQAHAPQNNPEEIEEYWQYKGNVHPRDRNHRGYQTIDDAYRVK